LKTSGISGIKRREYLKGKIIVLAVNNENTFRDLYRGIN
jgi:hypothetical protein